MAPSKFGSVAGDDALRDELPHLLVLLEVLPEAFDLLVGEHEAGILRALLEPGHEDLGHVQAVEDRVAQLIACSGVGSPSDDSEGWRYPRGSPLV